jgi:RNA polymerase sigma factor (sigma-70 family)
MLYIAAFNYVSWMIESENDLIARLKEGNDTAFRDLVEKNQGRVYNTCLGLVRNDDEADDLSQEVFIEVFRSIRYFRGDSKLSTWIYRIAVTKSLEHIRAKKRKKRYAILKSLVFSEDDTLMDIPDFNHPGVLAENRERAKILFQAIDQLPEYQKVAFTLNKIEGLSYEEIAAVMTRSVSSVESLLHRARLKLQEYLYIYYKS